MNGEFINLCTLAVSARLALKKGGFDYTKQKYVISEEYVFLPRKTFFLPGRQTVEKSADEWFARLKKSGLCDVKMMLPSDANPSLHGFSNSICGRVLCFFKSGRVTYFSPVWKFNEKERGWEIVFTEREWSNPPKDRPKFADNTDEFGSVLTEIAELADRIDEKFWAGVFRDAKQLLDGSGIPDKDDIPEKNMRLAYAAAKSDVFGAMGSWNDSPPYSAAEKGLSDDYKQLSKELFAQIQKALLYAVNEF